MAGTRSVIDTKDILKTRRSPDAAAGSAGGARCSLLLRVDKAAVIVRVEARVHRMPSDRRELRQRDALGVRLVEGSWRDFRLAVRALRATPVVTAVAVLSLALGIGANTAIFSVVDSLLLRTLPVADPGRLVLVTNTTPGVRAWSFPVWEELRRLEIFESVAAWSPRRFDLASRGETRFVDGLWTSGSFFETLGVSALIGRTFTDRDDQPSGGPDGPVAVISHRFWQRHFDGAPDVVGRTLAWDGVLFTIVGVTPPAFFGMEVGRTFDVAAPLGANTGPRGANVSWLTVVGRLKPGQTVDAATASLRGLQPRIRDATLPARASEPFRATYLQDSFALVSAATGHSALRRQYERPLLAIMVVVVLVMLVACANVANLLLARATTRRHEFSVRLALGASRWRLARQVLAESVVLAASGMALGVLIASGASRALVRELARQTDTQSTTVFLDLSLNGHVLAFTIGAAVATVMLFGIAPALRASGVTPMDTMKDGRGTTGDARARLASGLVVAQLTLSVVLVVAAGLFVRTFASLVSLPLGFEPDPVLVVTVSAQRASVDRAQRIPIFQRAVDAVQSLPGVAAAAASLTTPVSGVGLHNQIEVPGAPRLPVDERVVFVNHVSPGWFRTLDTPLLAGREFSSADGPGHPPVAIVNEAFGRRFLDGASPLGHVIRGLPVSGPEVPIVGLATDAVYNSLRESVPPTVYLPFAQSREVTAFGSMSLSIRSTGGSPASLIASATTSLNKVNPDLTWTFRPLAEQIDASITRERITAMLAGFFGGLALLLAGLGLYGVTAYGVSRRRSEISVRMALGASPIDVVRLVMSRVSLLVGVGAAAGMAASLWLSRFVAPLLHGLEPRDPATLLGAVVVLVAVGLAAGALPAARAARTDPAAVLRES
jgi:putative ABC transport system permease protein